MMKVKSFHLAKEPKKDVEQAYFPLHIWISDNLSKIHPLDLLQYGLERNTELYLPSTNKNPVAPEAIIEMESCKSYKSCIGGKSACRLMIMD